MARRAKWGSITGNPADQVDLTSRIQEVATAGAATWGTINGSLSNQTDLQSALDGKETSGAVVAHEQAANPHPTYLTATEGDAAYSALGHNHDASYAALSHTHAATGISDSTAIGRSVLTATDAAAVRTAIGAGTSSFSGVYTDLTSKPTLGNSAALDTGTTAGTVATGDHAHAGVYQPLATVLTNTTASFTTAQETKLSGVATGAQVNADITKAEIEAKLIGTISSHSHSGGGTATGVYSDLQMSILQGDGSLSAASGVQTWCGTDKTGQDVFTVAANKTYRVRGKWIVNTGATTHTTAMAWSLSTATVTDFQYQVMLWSAAANTIATAQSTTHVTGVASKVLNATSTAVYTIIQFEGIMVIGTGGTVTPQINFSANPTGTNLMKRGSWTSFELLGADTVTTLGGWA